MGLRNHNLLRLSLSTSGSERGPNHNLPNARSRSVAAYTSGSAAIRAPHVREALLPPHAATGRRTAAARGKRLR